MVNIRRRIFLPLLVVGMLVKTAEAQTSDSIHMATAPVDSLPVRGDKKKPLLKKTFSLKPYIAPSIMISYGLITLSSSRLKNVNQQMKEELWVMRPHAPKQIDNYLQFVPAAAVFSLKALGIKGKHNLANSAFIYLLSNGIMNTVVFSVKRLSNQLRPDGSDYYSFPSGHTAEAFVSAAFLTMEYKDVSPWYGVAGYAVAAVTGYLRMYNNKHWLNDVVAGAGVGIASTHLAYWLYPKIQPILFKNKLPHTLFMPTYRQGQVGVLLAYSF